jgi:murein DD-endopeptidase MepM/ murein hydrolase activator NlpD
LPAPSGVKKFVTVSLTGSAFQGQVYRSSRPAKLPLKIYLPANPKLGMTQSMTDTLAMLAAKKHSSLLSAIIPVLLAITVPGCRSDVTPFNGDRFSGPLNADRPPVDVGPVAKTGLRPAFRIGARVNPSSRARITGPVHPNNSTIGAIALREEPDRRARQNRKPTLAKNNNKLTPKESKFRQKDSAVSLRGSLVRKQQVTSTHSDQPKTDPKPIFQWPVRGKILAHFGPQPNGERNYGIIVAVPEDTPIKSAENGIVVYAGNELKGFGNMILVRHDGNYITVYAHAKELEIKRGDQVKRGEFIGRSGHTGDVNAPQLYFEIRKGSMPVDPLGFLPPKIS